MSAKGFDPARVTYSAMDARTANPPVNGEAFDCGSYYGDSARILGVSEVTAAIGGGVVGVTGGDWSCGGEPWNGCGLRCGGNGADEFGALMLAVPFGQSQPRILDVHFSPCLTSNDETTKGECLPDRQSDVTLEAKTAFNGLHNFQKSFYPVSFCQMYFPNDPDCGWRGHDSNVANSVLMLGEMHGHGLVPELDQPGVTNTECTMEPKFPGVGWDVRFARNTGVGFNQSTLVNRTLPNGSLLWVTFRPWEYPQHALTPPDPYHCNAGRLNSMYIPSQP